jgi:aspartate-semialdehyde dehydrogenase
MDEDVPLLIPEINSAHLALIETQRRARGDESGFIVTNPNCSTIMIALALAPLHARFGVEACMVTTMQVYPSAPTPRRLKKV